MKPRQHELASKFRILVLRRAPVVVFSAERTGTVGMVRSVRANGFASIASHYLAPANIGTPRMSGMARWACRHRIERRRPTRFITLVRDPIDMMLSSFARSNHDAFGPEVGPEADGALRDLFRAQWIESGRYRHHIGWMERELHPALGIDPYGQPFDPSVGAAVLTDGVFRLLILRTDLDDAAKSAHIGEFLEHRGFAMLPRDAVYGDGARSDPARPGSIAHHGAVYMALKDGPLVPASHLGEITGSRYVRHFFDAQSIAAMRRRVAPDHPPPREPEVSSIRRAPG